MLHQASDFMGYTVRALDGALGTVRRVLFDENRWKAIALEIDDDCVLPVEHSAGIDEDNRVITLGLCLDEVPGARMIRSGPVHSLHELRKFQIHALDQEFGKLEDVLLDDSSWYVRYLVVETVRWLPRSKRVLISPSWVKEFDWDNRQVIVDHHSSEIKGAPEYDRERPITRDYEEVLHHYYQRPSYWTEEEVHMLTEGAKVPWRESLSAPERKVS